MPAAPRAHKKRRKLTVKPMKTRYFALDGPNGCTNIANTKSMGKGVFLKSRASIRGVQPLHLRRGDHLVPVLDSYQRIGLKEARKHLRPLWFIECPGNQFAIILRSSHVQKSTIYYINASSGNIKPNVEWKYNMLERMNGKY